MKLGDIRMETPSVDSEVMLGDRRPWRCEVVYIHPKWRFYTVEFTTILGWKFRECFYFRDKRLDGPELPEDVRQQREMPSGANVRGYRWGDAETRPRFTQHFKPQRIYSR